MVPGTMHAPARLPHGRPSQQDLRQGHPGRHLDGSDCGPHLEGQTRFGIARAGVRGGLQGGNCDNGYSCAYSNSLSWRTETTPNPPEIRPRAVFERMFGAADDEKARRAGSDLAAFEEHPRYRMDEARSLKRRSGATIGASSTNTCPPIRDIEKRIQRPSAATSQRGPVDAPSASVPTNSPSIPPHDRHAGSRLPDGHDARHHDADGHRAEPA